jgi:hypothetical protein
MGTTSATNKNEERNLKIILKHLNTHFFKQKERLFMPVLYSAISSVTRSTSTAGATATKPNRVRSRGVFIWENVVI